MGRPDVLVFDSDMYAFLFERCELRKFLGDASRSGKYTVDARHTLVRRSAAWSTFLDSVSRFLSTCVILSDISQEDEIPPGSGDNIDTCRSQGTYKI